MAFLCRLKMNISKFSLKKCIGSRGKTLLINFQIIFYFLLLISICLTSESLGSTYYVDYVGGSDSNNGTSTSTPFKHCPGDGNGTRCVSNCQSTILKPGDIIYFKKGVTYRGQITAICDGSEVASGSNATITSSGIFISAGNSFLSTVSVGDLVYIYNSSPTGAWVDSVGLYSVASVDSDTQLTLANLSSIPKAAHSNAEMTYRIWRPITYTSKPDWGVGDATLSGHDDSDVPTWYYMIGTFANYVRFSQLKFQDTKYPDGYPGSSCTNATGGALTGWSANKKGLVIDNCKFNSVWRISPTSYTDYVILLNNIASDVGAIGYEGTGNYGLMENNTIDDAGGGIRGVGNYAVIRGNRLTNLAKSPSVICSFHADGIIAFGTSYAWIINNYFFNTLEGIYLSYTSGGTSNYTIANNVLIGNYDTGSGDYAIYANCAPKTRIYNNTIFGIVGDRGWLKAIGIGAMDGSNCPSPNCEVKNNIIYVPNGEHTWVGTVDANSTVGFVSDYNIIYIPNEVNGKPFKISGGDKTWAEWQAAGYDVHGSISQPTLVKVTGSNWGDLDLRLSSGDNVAKNKGITLTGFTKDIDNITRPQGSAWDIGAYEYTEALTPPNPPKSLRIVSP